MRTKTIFRICGCNFMMNLSSQAIMFLSSCVLGFCLAAVYDVFRITRIAVKTCNAIIFIEDLIFFIIVTISSFIFIIVKNDGVFRGFLIVGELLGAILYFFTLSILVLKAANLIINVVTSIFKFIFNITIKPVYKLIRFIFQKALNISKKLTIKDRSIDDKIDNENMDDNEINSAEQNI